ncbi:unnamed protein product [Phyllotreta striolata]|uniref:Immediate early response 3-interacting protein 1 n=1 Tax=Phyllotreta striolata TaxID=444603 RepID=A0A9N9TLY1_PHYSR|nr:unnamed protein product [Phyllotreta striolata]
MAFTLSLWNLFETSLLCLNAYTIINDERFFTRFDEEKSNKSFKNEFDDTHLYSFVHSMTTVSKYPIIFLNLITALIKLILGS